MLIDTSKNVAAGDIRGFKLVNGDEIVARIEKVLDNGWSISSPCTIIPSPQGLGLRQSMFSMKEGAEIELDKSHVMMSAPVDPKLEDHYKQTTSNIALPKKGGILT